MLLRCILSVTFLSYVLCLETSPADGQFGNQTSFPVIQTTTAPKLPNSSCQHHTTCEDCLKEKGCYFCQDGNKCSPYALRELIPSDECNVKSINYGTCQVNLLVVIILSAVAAVLVLFAIIACCCCCCRRGGRLRLSKDELKWARQREERRARAEEKRKERAARTMEIRQKYGFFKDEAPYQRFDT